jgi:hypothetical protein
LSGWRVVRVASCNVASCMEIKNSILKVKKIFLFLILFVLPILNNGSFREI